MGHQDTRETDRQTDRLTVNWSLVAGGVFRGHNYSLAASLSPFRVQKRKGPELEEEESR